MLKKSTVFNFLYIFQLIQKVLTSNFLNLVLNIHICLYKNSKILFLLEKNNFYVKISTFFFSQTPKSKAIFGIFVPSCPKSARNKVYQIYLNFSKIQSAAMSVDVSLRSKKCITVQQAGFWSLRPRAGQAYRAQQLRAAVEACMYVAADDFSRMYQNYRYINRYVCITYFSFQKDDNTNCFTL